MRASPQGGPARRPVKIGEVAACVGLLVVFVALLYPTVDDPLLERHDFRQTQTAYTARLFHENGIDLLHPRVPVLGEPFELPFEFPLYQASASLVMDLGVAEDTAMRATALACFLTTALLLFGLVRYVAGPIAAIGALLAFVVTPLAVVWSRASMIEYMASAGAVGFTWAFVAWRDNRRPASGVLCVLAGLVGMLVKPTTAIFWLLPALGYRPAGPRTIPLRRDPWAAALVVVPLAAAIAWTLHADAIKESTAATRWLTSGELRKWNLGTIGQRLDADVWRQIGVAYIELLISPVGLAMLVAAGLALVMRRVDQRRFWIALAGAAFLPPFIFTNLYFVHEYYLAAVAPAVAALVGLGAAQIAAMMQRPRARVAAIAAGVLVFSVWFAAGYRYWHSAVRGDAPHEAEVRGLADELDRISEPSELIAAYGLDWNPAVFYYARRRGHMVVPANEPFAFDLIHDAAYSRLLVLEPDETNLGFMSRWSWIGALTAHTYAIADDPSGVSDASFVSTEHGAEVDAHLSDAPSSNSPRVIECGRPVRIRAGRAGTWIELRDPPSRARIAVPTLASLPARALAYVAPEAAVDGSATITCSGAERLMVSTVRTAGPVA